MSKYPDWVLEITEAELLDQFGHPTLARGRGYALERRVSQIQRSGDFVTALVRGSGYQSYSASVVCNGHPGSLTATCTCPVRYDCKHTLALIMHMRLVQQRNRTPDWQRALSPLLTRSQPGAGGVRLALQLNRSGIELGLRPLRMGSRESWVKTGASWDDLRYRMARDFDPTQRDALVALLNSRRRPQWDTGYRPDCLALSEFAPISWQLLVEALASGIELLPGEDSYRSRLPEIVLVSEGFEPSLRLHQGAEGLRLAPQLSTGSQSFEPPTAAFIGHPAHSAGFIHDRQLLIGPLRQPFDEATHALFTLDRGLGIPQSDVPLFSVGFLPQLRRRFTVQEDPGLDLPAAQRPVLLCRVTFADSSAELRWGYRYTLGEQTHELKMDAQPTDPPIRDPHAEAELALLVPDGPWRHQLAAGLVRLAPVRLTGRELFDFTARSLPALRSTDGIEVVTNQPPPDYHEAEQRPQVRLSVSESDRGDWFDLGVEVLIGDEQVPLAALITALSMADDHLLLDSGTWFSLDHPELEQLRALIDEARLLVDHDGGNFQLRPEHAGLWEELVRLGVVAEQSTAWQHAVNALLDLQTLPLVEPPRGLRAQLRNYQKLGFEWLWFLWQTRLGGILADEMGLGKTVQALAYVQALFEDDPVARPVLVVAPTSVLGTWQSEAARFTPDLKVVAITETERRRGVPLDEAIGDASIVLTSYTLLRLEAEQYEELRWSSVLLDEAQFVKNHRSKAYQAVRRLPARNKIALTGTPLENNLMDLWSLLSITAPGLFADPKTFDQLYRKPIEDGSATMLARLQQRTRPLMLRRTKATVAQELPDKQEQIVPIELAPGHRRLYDKHLARERQKVLGLVGDVNRNRITILRSLTLLRQLALSPTLVDASYPASSAKIDTLVELLSELTGAGHRALVFSQFTGFLALIKQRLDAEQIAYQYLDGRTRDRAARIEQFKQGDAPVFLISLKAGGFGLTLTEADYVFICDPWWNPATESQAIDRTHRIGQTKPVNVYRLVASDTIEGKVVALQQHKRDLFDQVVGSASDIAAPLDADDIRALLDV